MTIVQIKGAAPDRYRAYAQATMTRKPSVEDHLALSKKGKKFAPGARVRYAVEQVAAEGELAGGALKLSPGPDTVITKVVFYRGPVESEVVVGSLDVGAPGDIAIDFELVAEPEAAEAVQGEVSEADLAGE
jgi:hypothetical protein